MLHAKSQGRRVFSGSGSEKHILKARDFTIYGHGGHLGHITRATLFLTCLRVEDI